MKNKEQLFEGSILKNEMTHTNHVDAFYKQVKNSYNSFPESQFWKDAFEFIEKRYEKVKR